MAGVKGRSGRKDTLWADAIRIEAKERSAQGDMTRLRKLAATLFTLAEEGDVQAIKEIGDRLDGKPHQTSESYVETETRFVIETPATAPSVDEWQQKHGSERLLQ